VFAWAPIAELKLITAKETKMRITMFNIFGTELTPQERPIIIEPRFGRRNSAREITAKSDMILAICYLG
jgi:hypothetical protein